MGLGPGAEGADVPPYLGPEVSGRFGGSANVIQEKNRPARRQRGREDELGEALRLRYVRGLLRHDNREQGHAEGTPHPKAGQDRDVFGGRVMMRRHLGVSRQFQPHDKGCAFARIAGQDRDLHAFRQHRRRR